MKAKNNKKLKNIKTQSLKSKHKSVIPTFDFSNDRNETVHTYNKTVANSIFQDLDLFDGEMIKLIDTLKKIKIMKTLAPGT